VTRLRVIVEGQTEEQFVGDSLAPHLQNFGVHAAATIVGKLHAQRRGHRQRGAGGFSTGTKTSGGPSVRTATILSA
jgi:hypothetical protein